MADLSAINTTALAGLIMEGLASEQSSQNLLKPGGMVRIKNGVSFQGKTMNVASATAAAAPGVVDFGDDTRVSPQSLADSMAQLSVKTLPLSVRVSYAYQRQFEAQQTLGMEAETIEGLLAARFVGQSIQTLRAAIVAALTALTGSTVLDASARTAPGGGFTDGPTGQALLQEFLGKFGDTDDGLVSWLAHSSIVQQWGALKPTTGVPYYSKVSGKLEVEGYPALKLDSGTAITGPKYRSYLGKLDSIWLLMSFSPEEIASRLTAVPVAQSTNLPAGVQYDLELDYGVIIPAKYKGTDRCGVGALITL